MIFRESLSPVLYDSLVSLEGDIYEVRHDSEAVRALKTQFYSSFSSSSLSSPCGFSSPTYSPSTIQSLQEYHQKLEESVRITVSEGSQNTQIKLTHAVISNNLLKVALFARFNANLHEKDSKGRGYAFLATSSQMIRLLRRYSVDIFQRSSSGDTALHHVIHIDAAEELIRQGISVMSRNNSRSTPIHYAPNPSIATLLISHGADPNALNYYEHTPLHLIASRGIWEIVYILLMSNCDLSITGRDGKTAIDLTESVYEMILKPHDMTMTSQSQSIPYREHKRIIQTIQLMKLWLLYHPFPPHSQARHTATTTTTATTRNSSISSLTSLTLSPSPHLILSDTATRHLLSSEQKKYEIKSILSWKTQELLCKNPFQGYIQATGLPADLIELIIVEYVGILPLQNQTNFREMNMTSMRKLVENKKMKQSWLSSTGWKGWNDILLYLERESKKGIIFAGILMIGLIYLWNLLM